MNFEAGGKFLNNLLLNIFETKNPNTHLILSPFSDFFFFLSIKFYKEAYRGGEIPPNLIELDLSFSISWKKLREITEKQVKNFCFSQESLFPFVLVFVRNFNYLSDENQLFFKNLIDYQGCNVKFFFFCRKIYKINEGIISRSFVSKFFKSNDENFSNFSTERKKIFGKNDKERRKIYQKVVIGGSIREFFSKKFLFFLKKILKKNFRLGWSSNSNEIFFFLFFLFNHILQHRELSVINDFFSEVDIKLFLGRIPRFLLLKKKKVESVKLKIFLLS